MAFADVVWSGVMGSAITVVGVLATNVGLSRRHREQLDAAQEENERQRAHDASESALERVQQLRREVFLPAVSGVISAMQAVSSMCDPSVPRLKTTTDYVDAISAIGRVNAVGSADTVLAVGDLLNYIAAAFNALISQRNVLEQIYARQMANATIVDRAVADHGRWIATQTELLFEGPQPPEKMTFVGSQITFFENQTKHWTLLRDTSQRELMAAQIVFLRVLAGYQSGYSAVSGPANIALRVELGLTVTDVEGIYGVLKRNDEIAAKSLQVAIDAAEERLRSVSPS